VKICFAHFRTILILALGIVGIVSMSCYTGLVIHAAFHDCDPISTHVREINGFTVTFADIKFIRTVSVTSVKTVLWYEWTGGVRNLGAEEVMYLDLRKGAIRIMEKLHNKKLYYLFAAQIIMIFMIRVNK